MQERLQFDGKIVAIEQSILARKHDLSNLEVPFRLALRTFSRHIQAMYVDANLVRDATRRELAQREAEMSESRAKRETEKQRLDMEAEERRKQYDLIEKRLRLASANDKTDAGGACEAAWHW